MSAQLVRLANDMCPVWCSTRVPPADVTDPAMDFAPDRSGDTRDQGWRVGVPKRTPSLVLAPLVLALSGQGYARSISQPADAHS